MSDITGSEFADCSTCVEYYWRDMRDLSWHEECRLKECHYRHGPGKDTTTERRLSRTGYMYWCTPVEHLTKVQLQNRDDVAAGYQVRLAAAEGSYETEEFRALVASYNGCCGYCGLSESEVGKLSPDHMIPLSRGGANLIDNIIPACRHCNDSKGAKTMMEYLIWLE